MSRIGKQPIVIPEGVKVTLEDGLVTVKGSKGEMSYQTHSDIEVEMVDGEIICSVGKDSKQSSALWGTTRARIANLVKGVSEGFIKELELHGVGYKAAVQGKDMEMQLGYSHPVVIEAPENIQFEVDDEVIRVKGIDKELVGQVAALIRASRKPEPYKGKGVRYKGEQVRRKVGKVVGATT